jgi:hypothetical protein
LAFLAFCTSNRGGDDALCQLIDFHLGVLCGLCGDSSPYFRVDASSLNRAATTQPQYGIPGTASSALQSSWVSPNVVM